MGALMTAPRFADDEARLAREALQTGRPAYVGGESWAMTGERAGPITTGLHLRPNPYTQAPRPAQCLRNPRSNPRRNPPP